MLIMARPSTTPRIGGSGAPGMERADQAISVDQAEINTAETNTAGSSPLLIGALMGCLGFSVVALSWSGSSASKTGPDKVDGQKRSRRAKENEVMALTGSTQIFFFFFYFVAMVGLCGVAYEALNTRGRGAMSGLLSVNSIVPDSCAADAAWQARRLVETGLVGA